MAIARNRDVERLVRFPSEHGVGEVDVVADGVATQFSDDVPFLQTRFRGGGAFSHALDQRASIRSILGARSDRRQRPLFDPR